MSYTELILSIDVRSSIGKVVFSNIKRFKYVDDGTDYFRSYFVKSKDQFKILHLLIRMAKMDRFGIVKDDVHIDDINPCWIEKMQPCCCGGDCCCCCCSSSSSSSPSSSTSSSSSS
jgi:hypothetical protein